MTSPSFFSVPSRLLKSACLAFVVVAVYAYFFTSLPSKLPQLPKPQATLTSKIEPTSAVHVPIPSFSLSTSHVSRIVSGNPSTKRRIKAHSTQAASPAYTDSVTQPIIQATKVHTTKMVTQASPKAGAQPHIKPIETISPMDAVANATLGVRL